MSTITHHTRPLNPRQYRVMALHCQRHNLRYSSRKLTHAMVIDWLTPTHLNTLIQLEETLVIFDINFGDLS